ncbi:MAG TPA: phosphoribosyltransferase family protein [Candidatus Acidoferrum sp.]|nr:phosphoribosyltransferase family protein [Candidatus Acidoferrum sp.]
MNAKPRVVYSPSRVASRVTAIGRAIQKDYAGRPLDAVILVESGFIFAADLVRSITNPVSCHFVRTELRDVELSGFSRREVFFSHPPSLKGRDVIVMAAILDTGVTMDFLCKRLLESHPRSLRIAVMVDRPAGRRVDLRADYFGFVDASNILVGYGLAGGHDRYRNLPYIGALGHRASARGGRGALRSKTGAVSRRRGKS